VIEDADPKSSILLVSNGSDAAVFAAYGLGRAVEETDIAVLSPGGNHAFQREFREFVLIRIRIGGHSVFILTEAPTPFNSPLGFSHVIPYDVAACCPPNGRRVNGSST
jgi:hypothetical protein